MLSVSVAARAGYWVLISGAALDVVAGRWAFAELFPDADRDKERKHKQQRLAADERSALIGGREDVDDEEDDERRNERELQGRHGAYQSEV